MKKTETIKLSDYVVELDGNFGHIYRLNKKEIDLMTGDIVIAFIKSVQLFAKTEYETFELSFISLNKFLSEVLVYSAFIAIPTYGKRGSFDEDYENLLIKVLSTVLLKQYDDRMICNAEGMLVDFQYYIDNLFSHRGKPSKDSKWKETDFRPTAVFLDKLLDICVSSRKDYFSEDDVFDEAHDNLIDLCRTIFGGEL